MISFKILRQDRSMTTCIQIPYSSQNSQTAQPIKKYGISFHDKALFLIIHNQDT